RSGAPRRRPRPDQVGSAGPAGQRSPGQLGEPSRQLAEGILDGDRPQAQSSTALGVLEPAPPPRPPPLTLRRCRLSPAKSGEYPAKPGEGATCAGPPRSLAPVTPGKSTGATSQGPRGRSMRRRSGAPPVRPLNESGLHTAAPAQRRKHEIPGPDL